MAIKPYLFGIMIFVFIFSAPMNTAMAQNKSNVEKTGDMLQILIPLTAYTTTFALGDSEGRTQFYKSFFTNLGMTYTLKFAINKPRPENSGDYSFPSGHTAAAFQGATFIHQRYGVKYGIPAYLGAAYVGWSRIEGESDQHDALDVAAGAAIGILSSYYFTTPYKDYLITPTANGEYFGISISRRW